MDLVRTIDKNVYSSEFLCKLQKNAVIDTYSFFNKDMLYKICSKRLNYKSMQ